jgi:hypothetical protein
MSLSSAANRLVDEALRMGEHPGVVFRPGPAGCLRLAARTAARERRTDLPLLPRRLSNSGSFLITTSSSPAKVSRPSLMLTTGITFSVHPSAL